MESIEIKLNIESLKTLINDNTVNIYLLGNPAFPQKVVNAKKLFDVIHTAVDCDKDTLVDYVKCIDGKTWMERDKYVRVEAIDVLFKNVQFIATSPIKEAGMDNLNGDPYIRHRNIEKIIELR